jgi:hypothetical protein
MDGLGDQFFSRTTFPSDQHGGLGSCHPPRLVEYFQKCGRLADNARKRILGFSSRRGTCAFAAKRKWNLIDEHPDSIEQLIVIPGLSDEVTGPGLHAFHRQLHRCPAGHLNNRQVRVVGQDSPE